MLRSNTRLVQLSVVVRDKKGQPVTDLKQSDFTVEDEGKPQEIRFFSVESHRRPDRVRRRCRRVSLRIAAPLTRARRAALPSFFWTGSIRAGAISHSPGRTSSSTFLRFSRTDRVALYTLGKELKILQDFTEEPTELVKALARYRGEHTPDLDGLEFQMAIRR